jgi:hypothetical protein
MKFVPLTPAELAQIPISAQAAAERALSEPGPGYGPEGPGGGQVVWKEVGCIFVGRYTGEQMPEVGYVPPTYPAYLVQVLADPVARFPLISIGVMVINARTGEFGPQYGGGTEPFGIVGTTCGVRP